MAPHAGRHARIARTAFAIVVAAAAVASVVAAPDARGMLGGFLALLMGAIALRVVTIFVSLVVLNLEQRIPIAAVLRELMIQQGIFFWPRLLFGVVVPIVLAAMIWSTVQLKHTQAATGLLYLAVVALLFGEFFSKFLLFSVNIPL